MGIHQQIDADALREFIAHALGRADLAQLQAVAAFFEVSGAPARADALESERTDIPVPEILRKPSDEQLARELAASRERDEYIDADTLHADIRRRFAGE